MANDPLSQFRKSPITPNGGMVPPTEADEYLAFGTKDKVRRLKAKDSQQPDTGAFARLQPAAGCRL